MQRFNFFQDVNSSVLHSNQKSVFNRRALQGAENLMDTRHTTPRYLPISAFQKLMIRTALDPETTAEYHQTMTVRMAFRITPGASDRTVQRAFARLVARHDSLRLRFVQDNSDWKAEILPDHPLGLIKEDLSPLSETEQTAIVHDRAYHPMTAFSDALFEMLLLKCGYRGDVILIRPITPSWMATALLF